MQKRGEGGGEESCWVASSGEAYSVEVSFRFVSFRGTILCVPVIAGAR